MYPLLGTGPATQACALTGNQLATLWFTGGPQATEPHQPGWKLVLLNSLILFHPSLHPSPLWQPSVCSLYLWVCSCFVLFVHLFCSFNSTYKWNHMVFVFLWLHLAYPLGLFMLSQMVRFHFFNGWVIFYYVYLLYLLYPFVYFWISRLFPCLVYCK